MHPGLATAGPRGFSHWDQLGQQRSCWSRARKAVTPECWHIWLVGTTLAPHLDCSPTPLLMGSAWPHGNTLPHPGRRRGDPTPTNTLTCIAPASSQGSCPASSAAACQAQAHPSACTSARAAGQSRGVTSVCWAPCVLESVGNLIRLCRYGRPLPGVQCLGDAMALQAQQHLHFSRM